MNRHPRRLRLQPLEDRAVPATLSNFLTNQHVDLVVGFTGGETGTWSVGPEDHDAEVEYPADDGLLYVGAGAASTRPAGAAFDFIGVPAGATYYKLPETQNPEIMYLGIAGEGIAAGSLDRYSPGTESGGRVSGLGRWARMTLVDVQGPGEFSVWQNGAPDPVVFMSSADGITAADSVWALAGGHSHFNYGFSAPGRYEVTVNLSGYLDDGNTTSLGTPTSGGPFTVYFSVGNVGQLEFDAASYELAENGGSATLTVRRLGGSDGRITVDYATADGTATGGTDYTATSGTLTFEDGETSKTITVPVINDSVDEPDETVLVTLTNPGPASIADYVADVEGSSLLGSQATATLTIRNDDAPGGNTPPTISDVADQATDEDTATAAIAFTVGDTQSALNDLIVTATSSNTTLVPTANIVLGGTGANRTATITPAANLSGTTTITLTVRDTGGLTATDTFVLTVNPVNDAPTADAQSVSTLQETPLAITLTGSDIEDDPLTFAIVSGPANGTLTGTGASRTYTPTAGFTGTDSFTFKANDGQADSLPVTLTITVTGAVAPTPADDTYALSAGNTVRGNVLANDTDPDGDPLTAAVETGPANGTLTLNPDGSFTYSPAGDAAADTFSYRATDPTGRSATATVTITPAGFQAFETLYGDGDVDIGVAYEDGWDLHVHSEETGDEFETAGALFYIPATALTPRPAAAEYDFLGVGPGEDYYRLPAIQNPELLYLGFGTEEIAPGTFVGGTLTIRLKAVNGPGELSLWRPTETDAGVVWSTRDGITEADQFDLLEGAHKHYNWGFSAKGRYEVTVEASGVLTESGESFSGDATYYFSVDNVGTVQFDAAAYGVAEGKTATLTVTRTGGSDGPATVSYASAFGTATAADFVPLAGDVTFADGETTKTIPFVARKDAKAEPVETATVTLTAPADSLVPLGPLATATVSIDTPTALKVRSVKVNDGQPQRSNIETVSIKFSRDTNVAALIASGEIVSAVTLFTGTTQVALAADRYFYDAAKNTLTIGLTAAGFDPRSKTILADGAYELRLDTTLLTSAAGGVTLSDTDRVKTDGVHRSAFHRLEGDFTGDRKVTKADENRLKALLGTYAWQRKYNFAFDLTGPTAGTPDGAVDQLDLTYLRGLIGR
ncbi:MAG TPA: choice-of-anchor M domain-containing protein [Gemmataceae bacterium]|nr:choice-of-anchor M domain-containing protein [Gemmataceae bacterium]